MQAVLSLRRQFRLKFPSPVSFLSLLLLFSRSFIVQIIFHGGSKQPLPQLPRKTRRPLVPDLLPRLAQITHYGVTDIVVVVFARVLILKVTLMLFALLR